VLLLSKDATGYHEEDRADGDESPVKHGIDSPVKTHRLP